MAYHWQTKYQDKIITPQAAADMIQNGDRIMTGNRDARTTLCHIIQRQDLEGVRYYAPIINFMMDAPNVGKGFRPATSFLNENSWELHRQGRLDYIPGEYWSYEKVATMSLNCNVALLEVTVPDENGYVSLGTCADYIRNGCKKADLIIAETNENFPFIYGGNVMHVSEFDYLVTQGEHYKLPSFPMDADPENEHIYRAIGQNLSQLIPNEATIEVGLGRLNSSSMMYLENVHDLGIHTEVYGDLMMELTKKGIVTNAYKSNNRGVSIFTQMTGTQELFDWAEKNLQLQMCPCQEVLNPGTIYQQHRMIAINNAVEVDLLGQANSEYLKGKQYSGMGGISNFASAATASPDGKSIVVLESVTRNGKFSKIVPFFKSGTPVSLPRTVVEYVVTEQGIAHLGGKTPSQRVHELIGVAHPKFREGLIYQAKELNLI